MKIKNYLYKFIRYISIYGFSRTLVKSLSRYRPKIKIWRILKFPNYKFNQHKVAIIGCGFHAYSSIAYYITKFTDSKIVFVYDINTNAAETLAFAFNSKSIKKNEIEENIKKFKPDLAYIATNHSTHTDYAIKFLKNDCDVYIEKPISINFEQLNKLSDNLNLKKNRIFAGYNRPYSKSMTIVKNFLDNKNPLTISYFIIGHLIDDDHWYRDPKEGSRIVGNVGHWIDLSLHILYWKTLKPQHFDINISYSNINTPSDNLNITMISNTGDLFNITFTSRGDPFEGVSEMINIQQKEKIIKIDDFRSTKVWNKAKLVKYKHWPKDNGHKNAVLEPYNNIINREWEEIKTSTKLMIYIENMIKKTEVNSRFIF